MNKCLEFDITKIIIPIVNTATQRYKLRFEYEDYKSECYIAGLNGVRQWENSDKKASLSSWVWIYVKGWILDFNKKKRITTFSIEDFVYEFADNDQKFTGEKIFNESMDIKSQNDFLLNKNKKAVLSYKQLINTIFPEQSASLKGISRQRVHQIKKKADDILKAINEKKVKKTYLKNGTTS